jgi:hypothetical protein
LLIMNASTLKNDKRRKKTFSKKLRNWRKSTGSMTQPNLEQELMIMQSMK